MARRKEYLDEYQVSPRVTLRRGDKFRVSAGPYYRMPDGAKMRMAVSGVCVFNRAVKQGAIVYIEAKHVSCRHDVVLHVQGRRKNTVMPAMVCRPYKIRGKVRVKKKERHS